MLCYQQYDPRALYDEFLVRKKEQMDAMRVVQPNVEFSGGAPLQGCDAAFRAGPVE